MVGAGTHSELRCGLRGLGQSTSKVSIGAGARPERVLGPAGPRAQSTSRVLVGQGTHAENMSVIAGALGSIYFQDIGRRGCCGPRGWMLNLLPRFFEGVRSEQVFWPAGSIDFQGLGRRGHSCRQCLRDRGRAGLNLLLSSWFARARVQRRVAACGVWGSIYFHGF